MPRMWNSPPHSGQMIPAEQIVLDLPWRVGRKLGRTVYAQVHDAASDDDLLIGMMDTAAFAVHLVQLHNEGLAAKRPQ